MTRLASRTARLRQIEELLLVTPEGLSVQGLAGRLDVDRRTIYRDLEFLEGQGVPLWQQEGRYGINRVRYLTTVRLTFHEATALVLAGLLLSRTIDAHNPHVARALRKVAVTLPPTLTRQLQRAAERVRGHSKGQRHVTVLEAIAEGWGSRQRVRVGYRSPRSGELRERDIAPYALEPTQSGIYVIAHDGLSGEMRTFKLDRLEYALVQEEVFTIPEEFNPEEYLAPGWRIMVGGELSEVLLRFNASATPHVQERHWHTSQELELLPGGGCLLRLEVSDPREMQPWIRSWGAQVEVLEPDWLRQQIADELCRAAEIYQQSTANS